MELQISLRKMMNNTYPCLLLHSICLLIIRFCLRTHFQDGKLPAENTKHP